MRTALCCCLAAAPVAADIPERLNALLAEGRSAEAERLLREAAESGADAQPARYALGVTQFIRAVERLGQSLNRYGARPPNAMRMIAPVPRVPVPRAAEPEKIDYPTLRKIFERWVSDLREVERTLSRLTDEEVRLPLRLGMIRLDLDSDGKATDEEALWRIYLSLNPGAGITEENAAEFVIGLDRADAEWLRGYCHLLMALGEVMLAHDFEELLLRVGHVFFERVDSPYAFLQGSGVWDMGGDDVLDLIAMIHLMRFPVAEPQRMKAALEHFAAMTQRSRAMWKFAMRETDDDNEWLPNPRQKSVLANLTVTQEMVDEWAVFLDEFDAIFAGRRLLPFWRGGERGINLRRVFTEPTTFDLVLWIQGSAAVPYLEEGTLTDPAVWDRLQDVFQGNFIGFAIWFN